MLRYQSCSSHLREFIPLPIICLVVGCIVGTICVAIFAQPEFELVAHGSPCIAAGQLGADCTVKSGAEISGNCTFGLTQAITGVKKCPLESMDYSTPAPKWKAYFVMNGIILTIGAPPCEDHRAQSKETATRNPAHTHTTEEGPTGVRRADL